MYNVESMCGLFMMKSLLKGIWKRRPGSRRRRLEEVEEVSRNDNPYDEEEIDEENGSREENPQPPPTAFLSANAEAILEAEEETNSGCGFKRGVDEQKDVEESQRVNEFSLSTNLPLSYL
jgi:hypothetical protein